MHTKEENSIVKKIILIVFIFIGNLTLNFFSMIGIMKYLSGESYAVKAIYIIIISIIIFTLFIVEAILTVDSSKANWAVFFCILMCIPIIFLVIFNIFHEKAPALTADFAHISCECFRLVHQNNDAHASIEEAISLDSEKYLYWSVAGDLYFEEENYKKCIYYYNKASELGETSVDILFRQGCAYRKTEEFDKALKNLTKAIEIDSENAEYHYELASVYHSYGATDSVSYDSAIQHYTTAIDIDPDNKNYYYQRAMSYFNLGEKENYAHAIDDLNMAISLQTDEHNYYYWRGRTYMKMDEDFYFEKAIDDFTEAIKIDSDITYYYFWRGMAYYNLKEYQKAIENYDISIKSDDTCAEYYYQRARAYNGLEDVSMKLSDIQKAIEYDGNNPVYHNCLGNFYYNMKNYEDAITEYSLSVQEASNNATYYFNLGDAYCMNKQYEQAIDSYSSAANINNTSILYLSRRGLCYSLIGDAENSKKDLLAITTLQEHGKEFLID